VSIEIILRSRWSNETYDPQFGARPLKRAVQEQLVNPLSMKLLEGDFKPKDKIHFPPSVSHLLSAEPLRFRHEEEISRFKQARCEDQSPVVTDEPLVGTTR
jgi:ATP-dependent Clp protease ATP-binding subunit ClpA